MVIEADLPPGWRWRRVADIADVVGGGTPSTRDAGNFNGDIPWLTPRDLASHPHRVLNGGSRSLSERGLKGSGAKLLPAGTVLLSSRAPVGYVAIAGRPLTTNQGFRSLILNAGNRPDYFYYLLRALRPVLESRANGTTFSELSGSALKEIELPVPPEEVQAAIAEKLNALDDKAYAARTLAKRFVRLAQLRYTQAPRPRSAAVATTTIEMLAEVSGGATPSTKVDQYWGCGHYWATPSDITKLSHPYLFETERSITDDGLMSCRARIQPPGGILLTSRASIGHLAVAHVSYATNQGILSLKPSEEHLRWALFHDLCARGAELLSLSSGTTFPELTRGALRKLRVSLPSKAELRPLHDELDVLHGCAAAAARQEEAAARLRDVIAPQLVFGQLA